MRRIVFLFSIFCLFSTPLWARADSLGQTQIFNINSQYDFDGHSVVSATLRKVSDHAYFYFSDDYWSASSQAKHDSDLSDIDSLAREFDNRIYPLETSFFGSEPNPGIDNDPKTTILITHLVENAGGYFDAANEYPKSKAPQSNEREMIYLNSFSLGNIPRIFTFLSHEFQHLISFNIKEKDQNLVDDVWTNEMRSEYAPTLLGYNDNFEGSNIQRRFQGFFNNPTDSLTEWKNLTSDYGQIAMFGEYVAEHWSPQIISGMLKNNLIGIPSFNGSLSSNNFSDSFLDVFRDWSIANFINDSSINSKLGYSKNGLKDFHISPSKVINNISEIGIYSISDFLKDWQGRWYDISQFTPGQKKVLKVSFSSPSLTSFTTSFIIYKNDGSKIIGTFDPSPSSNVVYLKGVAEDFNELVVVPIKKDKFANFTSDEPTVSLLTSFERVDSAPSGSANLSILPFSKDSDSPKPSVTPSPKNMANGSLIRAEGDSKVYVINGNWKRHIISSAIFNFYSQFGFNKVILVKPEVLDNYKDSDLIRVGSSGRVYSVTSDGKKHWLNMSTSQFISSGRSAEAIFNVNLKELNFYKIGVNLSH